MKDHKVLLWTITFPQIYNLEETDKFLETYNIPKLSHDTIENLNIRITSKDNESVIKSPPTNKSPGPDGFTGKFYQTLKAELLPIILKLFPKPEEEETLLNSS